MLYWVECLLLMLCVRRQALPQITHVCGMYRGEAFGGRGGGHQLLLLTFSGVVMTQNWSLYYSLGRHKCLVMPNA